MRWLLALVAVTGTARADVSVGAAVGAGGQDAAMYSGVDVRLDAATRWLRLGLGARAVWLDGALRDDWQEARDAVRALRLLEVTHGETVRVALAAGALAPPQLGHVADGYRAALDDRPRTGARAALTTRRITLGLEVDDVLEPGFAGGALALDLDAIVLASAAAIDPRNDAAALGLTGARRWDRPGARLELGGGAVVEPGLGAAGLGFVATALERGTVRWTAGAELRAGTGSLGAAFGPLHRIEEGVAQRGIGAAIDGGVVAPRGWLRTSLRARPGRGTLATLAAGAPMGRVVQAAGWIAASRDHAAGAAALRVRWTARTASTLEVARMYVRDDPMQPAFSASVWFGVSSAP